MTAIVHQHEPHRPTQTHAEVTRDVLGTLGTPSRGYYMALFGAIAMVVVGLATFTISVHNPFTHPVIVSLPNAAGGVPVSYGYSMRDDSGGGVSSGDFAFDVGITYFAAGETKRDVIDFFVIEPDFPSYEGGPGLGARGIALPVGTYSFQGNYGGKAATDLTIVLSQ